MRTFVPVVILVCLVFPGVFPLVCDAAYTPGTGSMQDAEIIMAVSIDILDAPGLEGEMTALARDLIYIEEGDTFTEESVVQTVDALKASGRFEEIDVRSAQVPVGLTLSFTLKPYRLIRDIRISGEFPLFEKDVLKVMTMYVGGVFTEKALSVQQQRIRDLFEEEGFIEPQIRVEAKEDEHGNTVVVHVDIGRGAYYSIDGVRIEGNLSFSAMRLKSRMSTWLSSMLPGSAGRFREKDLRDDQQRILAYYRSKGFPECLVSCAGEKDPVSESVTITCSITEGPFYEVSFSGNSEFLGHILRKDLDFFQKGNVSDSALKRSARNITRRYKDAGYTDMSIDIQAETSQAENKLQRDLHFVIHEGPRAVVDSLIFKGNRAYTAEELKGEIYLGKGKIFSTSVLEEDLFALKTFYEQNGFGDAVVDYSETRSEDRERVSIALTISEGVQTTVSSLRITGLTCVSEEEAEGVVKLKKDSPLRKYMLKDDENALSMLVSEKGYPHVGVQSHISFSGDGSEADVNYTVNEGDLVTMGNIYYRGNFKTRQTALDREIEMEKGDPFSLKKMLAGQKNIRDMDIFNSVQFKTVGLKEKRQEITLLADMEEKEPYYFKIGTGYESERGAFAELGAGDYNLVGANKYVWATGEVSQIGYKVETGIEEPRLLGTKTSATLGMFSEKRQEFNQDFGTSAQGASLGFKRKFTRHITAGLTFSFERRDQFLDSWESVVSTEYDEDEFDPRGILTAVPSVVYDTRDSFIRPTRGVYSSLSVDVSKGVQNSLDNFLKYRYELRLFVCPVERVVLAWLGRAGYLDPFGPENDIPDDQLFYLGGTPDVRGFDENMLRYDLAGDPLGGRFSLVSSLETRIYLWRNLELTCFYDIGAVRKTYEDAGSDAFRSSAGLGLRYLTPIGPIGALYGHKLDRKHGESAGRFHFSVGYTF